MADVSEAFLLCKTFAKDYLIGIENHCEKNHVILTFKDRGVFVYNLENNKLVHSLPVQQRKDFTSAVVQDSDNKKYVGIVENVNVCQWSDSNEDAVESQLIKVEQPIFKILINTVCPTEPVVVFQDGTSNLLSKCNVKYRKSRRKSTAVTQRILTCSLLQYKDTPLVCVAIYKENHLIVSASKLGVNEDIHSTREWAVDGPSEDEELISCCFQGFGSFNLVSYWSKGSLCLTDLKDIMENLSHHKAQEQNKLSCRCINRINKEGTKLNKTTKKPVVMAAMDVTHVCLSYETDTKQDSIHIYETKFGTKKGHITLEKLKTDQGDSSLARGSSIEHILCTEGYICMGLHDGVAACSCRVKESSLATALGKMTQDSRSAAEVMSVRPLLCIPQLPQPDKDLREWVNAMKTEQTTEETVLHKLTNPKKMKSVKEFTTELRQYLNLKHSVEEKEGSVDSVKKTPMKAKQKNKHEGKYLLSQHFVLTILSRCLEESSFWPKEALSSLIQTRCIPGSASPDLLKRLTEKDEIDMILKCLNNIQGIPESSLVSCLQYVLEVSDSVFGDQPSRDENSTGQTQEDTGNDGCTFGEKRSNLLCHLLSYPVNDVFIQDSIKKLEISQIMALMNFLAHIVKSAPRSFFARKGSPLDYPTALDWTGWIINAHYTTLVLNSKLHGLLLDLQDSVQDQVTMFEILGRVEGFLAQYKSKQPLPAKENVGLYAVEMLEL